MSDKSKIEWTEATWNPVVGCTKVSAGCANCYAEKMAYRLACMGQEKYQVVISVDGGLWNHKIFCDEATLDKPRHWRKPRRIFVCSMGDLFHPDVPESFIAKVFNVIRERDYGNGGHPGHTFQILTKRPERAAELLPRLRFDPAGEGKVFFANRAIGLSLTYLLKNLWLGVTCENQATADKRIPQLLQIPAAVRFVSVEPMLGPVDLEYVKDYTKPNRFCKYERIYALLGERSVLGHRITEEKLDWVIIGCETGPGRRPCKLEWVRDLIKRCDAAKVPVFIKALLINGKVCKNIEQWPPDLQRREYPRCKEPRSNNEICKRIH